MYIFTPLQPFSNQEQGNLRRNGGVRVFNRGAKRRNGRDERFDQVQMKPHAFSLRANNATFTQRSKHRFVERCFEQDSCGSDWVTRVRDDDVE